MNQVTMSHEISTSGGQRQHMVGLVNTLIFVNEKSTTKRQSHTITATNSIKLNQRCIAVLGYSLVAMHSTILSWLLL